MEFRFGLKQRIYNWHMRVARQAKGWCQRDLANATSLSAATIGHFENLRQFPSLEQSKIIAEALGQDIETLFPDWLKAFKLRRVPEPIGDRSISLKEAIERRLIPLDSLSHLQLDEGHTAEDIERQVDLQNLIPQALDCLTPRERRVIELRFGLDGGHSRTLDQIGRIFNVTRPRIQEIEGKALRKLRQPSNSKGLRDLI